MRIRNPSSGNCVLFCHGFPGGNRLPGLRPDGVAVAELDYRGDPEREGTFSFLGCIDDAMEAAEHLRKRYRTLIALGYSAGGLYVLNAARRHSGLFDRIVLLNPVVDARVFLDRTLMDALWESARKTLRLKDLESYDGEIELLIERHNPMQFADEMDNLTIVQSTDDEILDPSTARSFARLSGGEYVRMDGKGHELDGAEPELINALDS